MASIRFLDVEPDEDLENGSPLHGLQDAENMPLEDACKVAKAACGQLATWDLEVALGAAAWAVKRLEKNLELAPLLHDEARAVHVYTQESLFYKELNKRLRLRERESLKPFFPYLKQFLNGLHRLAPEDDTVFRGVRLDLSAKYCQGNELVWWAFSSATSTAAVLNNDTFLGQVGDRTLFSIKVHRCVNIRKYSAIGNEDERLILPGTAFHVKSHLALGGGLTMIQLEEDRECPPLISGFAFTPTNKAAVADDAAADAAAPIMSGAIEHLKKVAQLVEMGFTRDKAISALKRANNAIEVAMNFLIDADAGPAASEAQKKEEEAAKRKAANLAKLEAASKAKAEAKKKEEEGAAKLKSAKLANLQSQGCLDGNEKALIEAAQKGDTTTVVALLKAGTNPNCHNEFKDTPLHEAARYNRIDAVKVLLAHGADVTALTNTKQTPLHYAAFSNSVDAAKVLLTHGADVNARAELLVAGNQQLGTPLDFAKREGHREMEALLLQK